MIYARNVLGKSLNLINIGANGLQFVSQIELRNIKELSVNSMYEPDITEYIGESMVEEMLDDTEPNGIAFNPGNPINDYRNQAVRELNSR